MPGYILMQKFCSARLHHDPVMDHDSISEASSTSNAIHFITKFSVLLDLSQGCIGRAHKEGLDCCTSELDPKLQVDHKKSRQTSFS
ncbi:unnamed protein product [Calypogeia fissa]